MFIVLIIALSFSPLAAFLAALSVCILGLVAVMTGYGIPRLRGRVKGISVFAVSGVVALVAWQAHQAGQLETRWAGLRQSAPDKYLQELKAIDQDRWLEELRELRPESYLVETERREAELAVQRRVEAAEHKETDAELAEGTQRLIAGSDDLYQYSAVFARIAADLVSNGTCSEAEFVSNGGWVRSTTFGSRPVYFMYCGGSTVANRLYLDAATGEVFRGTDGRKDQIIDENQSVQAATGLAKCSDRKTTEAYVMIQADVRRSLVAPSTAEFPWRYGAGTRYIGNCVYQVNGYFDAQNGFGAMLRSTFTGTIRYFPESGSWQTQSLHIK